MQYHIHLISDSTGETVSSVFRAAIAQFDGIEPEEHLWTLVRTRAQIEKVIHGLKEEPGVVMYTLLDKELIEMLKVECSKLSVPCIPVIANTVSELSRYFGKSIAAQPGRQHQMDAEYFTKMEAINYSLAHDDGQNFHGLSAADIILVGPSRTSKSPTCMYLAYKGYKSANVPFVMGCPLPPELESLKKPLIVGLTISADRLEQIRRTRLQSLNQDGETNYVDGEKIREEIEESRKLFHRNQWPVIDVSKRSVEETAATILQFLQRHQERQEAAS